MFLIFYLMYPYLITAMQLLLFKRHSNKSIIRNPKSRNPRPTPCVEVWNTPPAGIKKIEKMELFYLFTEVTLHPKNAAVSLYLWISISSQKSFNLFLPLCLFLVSSSLTYNYWTTRRQKERKKYVSISIPFYLLFIHLYLFLSLSILCFQSILISHVSNFIFFYLWWDKQITQLSFNSKLQSLDVYSIIIYLFFLSLRQLNYPPMNIVIANICLPFLISSVLPLPISCVSKSIFFYISFFKWNHPLISSNLLYFLSLSISGCVSIVLSLSVS